MTEGANLVNSESDILGIAIRIVLREPEENIPADDDEIDDELSDDEDEDDEEDDDLELVSGRTERWSG